MENQKEALAAAIEMENQGRDFYNSTAEKTANEMTRSVFRFLADEETKHIEAIRSFYSAEMAGEETDFDSVIREADPARARKAISKLFSGLERKAPTDKADIDAYKFARDFEKNGEKFYRQALTKATDPETKKLFQFLIEEEQRHFQMVDDSLAFLENPSEWFHRLEKWHVEG